MYHWAINLFSLVPNLRNLEFSFTLGLGVVLRKKGLVGIPIIIQNHLISYWIWIFLLKHTPVHKRFKLFFLPFEGTFQNNFSSVKSINFPTDKRYTSLFYEEAMSHDRKKENVARFLLEIFPQLLQPKLVKYLLAAADYSMQFLLSSSFYALS